MRRHLFPIVGLVLLAQPARGDEEKPLWSLQSVKRPSVPAVKDPAWQRNDIDRFLLARLEKEGLTPAKDADPVTLLRRLTFALTGLPPTPQEVDDFTREFAGAKRQADAALINTVERLLASKHFGERWARHWMDLVCYSDSHGIEHDPLLPHAWRYRDYLIRAFNDDVPYDRFVKEHIAGDLLPPRWNKTLGINEAPAATVFFRFVELFPTPVDVKNEEMTVLEQQIDTFGKTFQGLTIACARCHDHKYDPVTAKDYYALYGILASPRVTMHALDDPARLHGHDGELKALKDKMRPELARLWRKQAEAWPALIQGLLDQGIPAPTPSVKDKKAAAKKEPPKTDKERWISALQAASSQPAHPLYPLAQMALSKDKIKTLPKLAAKSNLNNFKVFADFTTGDLNGWHGQGQAFARVSSAGDFAVAANGAKILTGIYPRGRYSHLISDKHPGALRSPNFIITSKHISALVCGTNESRLRLIIENFPGDELLFANVMPKLNHAEPRWVTLPIRDRWEGNRAYLEVSPRDEMTYPGRVMDATKVNVDGRSGVGILKVVFHDQAQAPEQTSPLPAEFWQGEPATSEIANRFKQIVAKALDRWPDDRCSDDDARLLDALVRGGVLTNEAPADHPLGRLLGQYRAIEARIPVPQRAVGLIEEEGFESPFFAHGNYKNARKLVPRRYLEVLDSQPYRIDQHHSGRLQLAEEIASAKNPLTARVMVNRLWHHLFGAGLVRSVDNFGELGEKPSHPELLDWLAAEFMDKGWSVKHMIRLIVTSRAFQLASDVSPAALEKDPENRLWSRAPVRRLDAESLRDTLLAVSGRLDRKQFGLGVPLPVAPYKDFYVPVAGPLDGNGRRSVYLETRRNFLSPFLMTFDQPRPIATTGQRNVTNVPAQGLALQNDPFVLQQAELFAKRVLALKDNNPDERVKAMYRLALSRAPESEEGARAMTFLQDQAATYGDNTAWQTDVRVWRDLAHALFNMKEFIYLK